MAAFVPPDLPPFLINGSSKNKYVMTYKNHWIDGRSVRGKGDTHCVGKFIPVEGEAGKGELFFNEDFKKQYPALENLRVFRYKGGKLEFKPIDDEDNLIRDRHIERLHGGAVWSLEAIVKGTPLEKALNRVFSQRGAGRRLLSLAYFLILEADPAFDMYEVFAEKTWLPYAGGRSGGAISRFLSHISADQIAKFLKALNEEYRKAQGEHLSERKFWALDSTSISSYSENIASVEYGHNKDLMPVPQTNVMLIVDQETGEPILYRNYDGNVPDVSTIRNTLAEMTLVGIDLSNVVLVTDKGYCSKKNWEDMLRNNVSFISNAKRTLNSAIQEIVDENYVRLQDWNNGISFIKQNAVTVPVEWHYDEFPIAGKKAQQNAKRTLYFHLYFNEEINRSTAQNFKGQLCAAVAQHRKDPKELSEQQKTLINSFTDTLPDGSVSINMKKVDEKIRYAGIRVLVSDAVDDALKCYTAYEERNAVEYSFNMLKAKMNCNRTRAHSQEGWEGRLFVEVLATVISGMVRARIKQYNANSKNADGTKKYRVHHDSDRKLLGFLNNIYMTKFNEGWFFDEIVGKKKELFQILNVPIPTVKHEIHRAVDEEEPDVDDTADIIDVVAKDDLEDL